MKFFVLSISYQTALNVSTVCQVAGVGLQTKAPLSIDKGASRPYDSDRIRTCDQVIKSHLLCQLSYGAVTKRKYSRASMGMQTKSSTNLHSCEVP